MDGNFFRIYGHKWLGVAEDGAVVEMALGCDGTKHAGMIQKLYYAESGDLEFAQGLGTVDCGRCRHDQMCKDFGFFSHKTYAQT